MSSILPSPQEPSSAPCLLHEYHTPTPELSYITTIADNDNDDADLPPPLPLPQVRPSLKTIGRKRTRDDFLADSSDPPLFSSDDLPASSENYVQHRVKRQSRQTWWGDRTGKEGHVCHGRREKRQFKRTVDSGVWMGSEDSDHSHDKMDKGDAFHNSVPVLDENRQHSIMRTFVEESVDSRHRDTSLFPPGQPDPQDVERLRSLQNSALMIVQDCVENGRESVDLSWHNLCEVWGSTLRPLRYLTKQSQSTTYPPSQEAYGPLTPSLCLYLPYNNLTNLPGELFNITNLTVLSLRQNHLKELPPAISKLSHLQELNLSTNALQWLPWEILDLVRGYLEILNVLPNPFVQPLPPHGGKVINRPACGVHDWTPYPIASTGVAFLGVDGTPCRDSPPAPSQHPDFISPSRGATGWQKTVVSKGKHHPAPSLLEVALRECSKSSDLSQMILELPDDSPPSLPLLLEQALRVKETGGTLCSVCERDYIIPRTEWIEWWDCISPPLNRSVEFGPEDAIPLMRRGCSWKCVPSLKSIPVENRGCGWSSMPMGLPQHWTVR